MFTITKMAMIRTILFKVLVLLTMAHAAVSLQAVAQQATLHAWQRSVAGAGAYLAATIVTSPMDVVKTRAQAPGKASRNSVVVALEMLRNEGVASFFSGLTPALFMVPAAMVQYTLIDPLRARFPLYIAAMIAGALDITIKCPFDRLKTQMQNDRSGRSMSALFADTLKDAGVSGLWAGYTVTLVRDLPYLVIKWLVFAQVQALLNAGPLAVMFPIPPEARNLVAGAVAGGVAATAVTPVDVIKTRLQIASAATGGSRGSSIAVARSIIAEDGVAGLFSGLGPRLARIPFYTSITLATFEGIKDSFLRGQIPSAAVGVAAAALVGKREL